MLRAFGHPVATCCDVLGHVGCCWLKFETGQIFHATFVDAAWSCSRLARFVQQCCTRACALVRFSIPNMSQHVATGWRNVRNMLHPTLLRYVVLKCCDRLAGACKCWANNVAICCVDMLRSFDRNLQMLGQQCCDRLVGASVISPPSLTYFSLLRLEHKAPAKRSQHFNTTYPNIVGPAFASPGQTNHFQTWANNTQHVPTHRHRVAKRTQHVATCWVLLAQVWKWSNFTCNICGCCMMLYSFGQIR